MGFLKSFFSGKSESPEKEQKKNEQKNFEIFKYDGMRAQRMGRLDYAVKCFVEALALQKDFETMGYLAQAYTQTNELEKARQVLDEMVAMEPHHTATLLTLANLCYMQEDYPGMAEAARKAIAAEEGNAVAHYLLGKAEQGRGEELMCIAHLTRAIVLNDEFIEARLLRAEALMKMGQQQEAQEDIKAVLLQDADNESALLLRGKSREALQQPKAAETDYARIIELNPFNEQAYLALGNLYIGQKRMQEAISLLDDAIDLNPNFAQAYHERGRAKLLNGDKEGSLEDMKKELELNPKEAEALNGHYDNQPTGVRQTDILGL